MRLSAQDLLAFETARPVTPRLVPEPSREACACGEARGWAYGGGRMVETGLAPRGGLRPRQTPPQPAPEPARDPQQSVLLAFPQIAEIVGRRLQGRAVSIAQGSCDPALAHRAGRVAEIGFGALQSGIADQAARRAAMAGIVTELQAALKAAHPQEAFRVQAVCSPVAGRDLIRVEMMGRAISLF